MHRREVFKTTNTARLATIALTNAELRLVGRPEDRVQLEGLAAPALRAVLLYPSANARPLTRELAADGPLTLVVPDGNWRQAKKMAANEEQLEPLPHVTLPAGPPSRYTLRTHPDPRFLATLEAIARALGILEGEAVQRRLEELLARKVDRALDRNPSRRLLQSPDAAPPSHAPPSKG